ncbi:hypothetical protein QBC40DRAFT_292739 [Triangularia verruculosa]|uniref:BTB domain-containing protein n=1 Tax=Triangularia verruculosa TaxID=2587418 RepID=A0AAN7B142_9PEZI|nr:hypothetical protein QBC40DRAFT_292739 [Triangularia verruculosa]
MKFFLTVAVTAIAGIVTAIPVEEREVEALEALSMAGTATDATTNCSARCPSLTNFRNIPILPIPLIAPACAGGSCGAHSGTTGSSQGCLGCNNVVNIIPVITALTFGACSPATAATGSDFHWMGRDDSSVQVIRALYKVSHADCVPTNWLANGVLYRVQVDFPKSDTPLSEESLPPIGEFVDVELNCKGRIVRCHRGVIYPQWPNPFQKYEPEWRSAPKITINFSHQHDHPWMMQPLLDVFYRRPGAYQVHLNQRLYAGGEGPNSLSIEALTGINWEQIKILDVNSAINDQAKELFILKYGKLWFNLQMYLFGDRYSIPTLRLHCLKEFHNEASKPEHKLTYYGDMINLFYSNIKGDRQHHKRLGWILSHLVSGRHADFEVSRKGLSQVMASHPKFVEDFLEHYSLSARSMMETEFLEHMEIDNTRYTDMTTTCRGREWKAHRAIVCTSSKYFEAAWNGPWKAGFFGTSGIPTFGANELIFIYTGKYSSYVYTVKTVRQPDVDVDDQVCSPLLTKDELLDSLDEFVLPTAFNDPDISEQVFSEQNDRGDSLVLLSPQRIREGLWISLHMYLLGDLRGIDELCDFAAARFHDFGSLFAEDSSSPPSIYIKHSPGFVGWVGKVLVSIIDPLYSTLPPITNEKGRLHRNLCHLLLRNWRCEEHRAALIPMMVKHETFLAHFLEHLAKAPPHSDYEIDGLLMRESSVNQYLWEEHVREWVSNLDSLAESFT